ncbi:hypothetical protein [Lysobacter capsici]|uniref:hypothetical protein n=1 Tax=Lysobacter capsici TaxID=435897 RepID=UPI001C008B34|nr:hypothetical protein [Lysobacter capsici]QWF16824.1 hypothetical protein KME82_24305 [Lysobacter capsici]
MVTHSGRAQAGRGRTVRAAFFGRGIMTVTRVMTRNAAPRATIRRRPLAAALLVALALPGLAFAQTAKEKELEARVADLERMVQQLVSQQQQVQTQVTEVKAAQASAPVAAVAAPGKPSLQTAPINPGANPGTRFSYGGFIKLDASVTSTNDGDIADGSVGRLFYVPKAIPVGGGGNREGSADTDMGANFSRFWRHRADDRARLARRRTTAFTGTAPTATSHQAYVSWTVSGAPTLDAATTSDTPTAGRPYVPKHRWRRRQRAAPTPTGAVVLDRHRPGQRRQAGLLATGGAHRVHRQRDRTTRRPRQARSGWRRSDLAFRPRAAGHGDWHQGTVFVRQAQLRTRAGRSRSPETVHAVRGNMPGAGATAARHRALQRHLGQSAHWRVSSSRPAISDATV